MSKTTHLKTKDLCIHRDTRCLVSDLNLEIPRGSFVAIVGPSGVGKTSLLSCLAGLISPARGKIAYFSQGDTTMSPREFQDQIGLIFQNFRLSPNSPLLTNVLCGSLGAYPWWQTLLGFPEVEKNRAMNLLNQFGLQDYCYKPASCLSGGEQQRAAIARAFMQDPEIIFADEPISQLDESLSIDILNLLKQQTLDRGVTVLCVLHDYHLVERFADYVLTLDKSDPCKWRMEVNAH